MSPAHKPRPRSRDPAPTRLTAGPPSVSLGVVASAIVVSLGAQIGDPIIGLAITLVILHITWQSWRTVTMTDPGDMIEPHVR